MKELRDCKKHGATEFVYRTSDVRWRCLKCCTEATQKRREILKQKAVEYKGGKCSVCGYSKTNAALEFHHTDGSTKEFGIGANGYTRSWGKVKEELDKCILVCANCHRELHNS